MHSPHTCRSIRTAQIQEYGGTLKLIESYRCSFSDKLQILTPPTQEPKFCAVNEKFDDRKTKIKNICQLKAKANVDEAREILSFIFVSAVILPSVIKRVTEDAANDSWIETLKEATDSLSTGTAWGFLNLSRVNLYRNFLLLKLEDLKRLTQVVNQ